MILNKCCIYFFFDLNNSHIDITVARITNRSVLDKFPYVQTKLVPLK